MFYYYDSCVFCNALNSAFSEHEDCLRITTPSKIGWGVSICPDLINSETTIGEFVATFEVECALNGISLQCVTAGDVSSEARKLVRHKKPLSALGLRNLDWKHAVAAVTLPCKYFVSTDQDFRDPVNKAVSNGKGMRVKKYLSRELGIEVVWPSEVA